MRSNAIAIFVVGLFVAAGASALRVGDPIRESTVSAAKPLVLRWNVSLAFGLSELLAVGDMLLAVETGSAATLAGLRRDTGALVWSYDSLEANTDSQVFGVQGVPGLAVYQPYDCYLFMNVTNGNVVWPYCPLSLSAAFSMATSKDGLTIYLSDGTGVGAYRTLTGASLWVNASIAAQALRIGAFGRDNTPCILALTTSFPSWDLLVTALHPGTGEVMFNLALNVAWDVVSQGLMLPIPARTNAFYVLSSGYLLAVDISYLRVVWTVEYVSAFPQPNYLLPAGASIAVLSEPNAIAAIAAKDGSTVWNVSIASLCGVPSTSWQLQSLTLVGTSTVVVGGVVCVSNFVPNGEIGVVFALHAASGKRLWIHNVTIEFSVVPGPPGTLLLSQNNFINNTIEQVFDIVELETFRSSQRITWAYPNFNGGSVPDPVSDVDGVIYLTEPSTTVTQYLAAFHSKS